MDPRDAPAGHEPPDLPEGGITRRRFLALLGATAALAATAGCGERGTVVPATRDVAGAAPGVAETYASAFVEGIDLHPVLVRTREGRPLHIEGNDRHPASDGKTSHRALADLLRLYDPDRLRTPSVDGRAVAWADADAKLAGVFRAARTGGSRVLLVTGANLSPTRAQLLAEFATLLPGLTRVTWEPTFGHAGRIALVACHGEARRANLRLDKARVIVGFEPDLLGGHRPAEVAGFTRLRPRTAADAEVNRLYVFEGGLSLTGAAADHRFPVKPSRAAGLAFALAGALAKAGVPLPPGIAARDLAGFELDALGNEAGLPPEALASLVADLARERGRALVVAGPALPNAAQVACRLLNAMLDAEGATEETAFAPELPAVATSDELAGILSEAAAGAFGTAVFWDVNPALAGPDPERWKAAISRIPMRIAIATERDETAEGCNVVLPAHHWLEAWGDFEGSRDLLTLRQPALAPLHATRQGEEILLGWMRALGSPRPGDYLEVLKGRWRSEVHPQAGPADFDRFWRTALHDGFASRAVPPLPPRNFRAGAVAEAIRAAAGPDRAAGEGFELVLTPAAGIFDGRYGNNGWLQEWPDPVTKLTWGNAVSLSGTDAGQLGFADGDLATLEAGAVKLELPVLIQAGQAAGTLATTFGYGRRAGAVARGVGVDVYPLVNPDPLRPYCRSGVRLTRTGRRVDLPVTQGHHRLEGRDLIEHFDLVADREALASRKPPDPNRLATLYPALAFPERKWGMAIDLAACVGCSACVLACQSENNIPCVGPEQVVTGREMHWLRIDRYYEGDGKATRVLYLPVLCQQCDNAPCETVCPVTATNHSPDGLNQMAYNRCVGTRYCGNNCPYKVRRFNFFEYAAAKTAPENLVYNPEVTVRPRGVMEKCTFCVQRIQEARMRAKAEGRALADGEIVPACAAACPARAITFGDLLDPASRVAKLAATGRGFKLLEELGVKPAVTYLAHISNRPGREG